MATGMGILAVFLLKVTRVLAYKEDGITGWRKVSSVTKFCLYIDLYYDGSMMQATWLPGWGSSVLVKLLESWTRKVVLRDWTKRCHR